jgi:hypothetical protein
MPALSRLHHEQICDSILAAQVHAKLSFVERQIEHKSIARWLLGVTLNTLPHEKL